MKGLRFIGEWSPEIFMEKNALWQRSCHQQFNNSKLERVKNRKRKLEPSTTHEGNERSCLLKYRNKYRSFLCQQNSPKSWSREQHKARAFTELVGFIEASLEEETYLFMLSELHHLYQQRLNDLGEDITSKTRFKDMLLQHFSEMGVQEQSGSKNIVLVIPEGMYHMLQEDLNNHNSKNLLFAK